MPDEDSNDERDNKERNKDKRSHVDRAEEAVLAAIRAATTVNNAIHEMAAAIPKAGDEIPKDAPLPYLLMQAEGIARLMMATNAGISETMESMRRLPVMRAEEAAGAPGAQTVCLPGQDYPRRETIDAIEAALKKFRGKPSPTMTEEDYPLKAEMEAYDRVSREYREEEAKRIAEAGGSAQGGTAAKRSGTREGPWGEIEDVE